MKPLAAGVFAITTALLALSSAKAQTASSLPFRLGEPMDAVVSFVREHEISASLGGDRISATWTVDGTLHKLDVAACPDDDTVIGAIFMTRRGPELSALQGLDDAYAQLEAMGVPTPTELHRPGDTFARYGLEAVSPDEVGYVSLRELGRIGTVSLGLQSDCHPPASWQVRRFAKEAGQTNEASVETGGDQSTAGDASQ